MSKLLFFLPMVLLMHLAIAQAGDKVPDSLFDKRQKERYNLELAKRNLDKSIADIGKKRKDDSSSTVLLTGNYNKQLQDYKEKSWTDSILALQKADSASATQLASLKRLDSTKQVEFNLAQNHVLNSNTEKHRYDSLQAVLARLQHWQDSITNETGKLHQAAASHTGISDNWQKAVTQNLALKNNIAGNYAAAINAATSGSFENTALLDLLMAAAAPYKAIIDTASAVKNVAEKINKFQLAHTFMVSARQVLGAAYNPDAVAALLTRYKGIEKYPAFTEEQQDELTTFTKNLQNYCRILNNTYTAINNADLLIKSKPDEAKATLLRKRNDVAEKEVFVYVVAELTRLLTVADGLIKAGEAPGKLVKESNIKKIDSCPTYSN